MEISVVVPIFNEEANLSPLHARLTTALKALSRSYEIIYVNDGSKDRSGEVLEEIARQDKAARVVHFRRNFGQTAAIMAGFDFSVGKIIVCIDGDLQNDPDDIARLLAKLEEGFDVVSGWRKDRKDQAIRRNLPSRIANRLISFISGVRLNDYGCTLKAYRRSVIQGVRLYGEMHRFIPIYASWQGARVIELPVKHHPRVAGKSKYGLERTIKVVLDLIVIKFLSSYSQKPIYVFGGVAFINFIAAFLLACGSVFFKLAYGISFIRTPLPLLMVLTFMTGTMCLLMGLLAEIIMRTYYESQDKPVYLVSRLVNLSREQPVAGVVNVLNPGLDA
jgi:glycosyltransferase involved in cell wall biosynthesis